MFALKPAAQCLASTLATTLASKKVILLIQKNSSFLRISLSPSAALSLPRTQHNALQKYKFNTQFPNTFFSYMGLTIPRQQNQRRIFKT